MLEADAARIRGVRVTAAGKAVIDTADGGEERPGVHESSGACKIQLPLKTF
jgi:hypothetical protein